MTQSPLPAQPYTAAERAWISQQADAIRARRAEAPMHFPARAWVNPLAQVEATR